jgi:hypothetical protein
MLAAHHALQAAVKLLAAGEDKAVLEWAKRMN